MTRQRGQVAPGPSGPTDVRVLRWVTGTMLAGVLALVIRAFAG